MIKVERNYTLVILLHDIITFVFDITQKKS